MADSYSVKAILSAKDSGFTSTLKSAGAAVGALDSKISGIGFGILTGVGQAAFNTVTSSVSGLIGEINDSNVAWKTFEKNMKIVGKGDKEIAGVKSELQEFAQQTVYSASDMASTYSQLSAVGVKNTDKLVKGFGGLAAAAEDPQQAMKTLSQQATQMAAKPKVAWEDFKLMLEQSPAGMAAVAKEMGMSTEELVSSIQDGEVATEDLFDAITKVGNSDAFMDLATTAKSAGQAMDGLKETLANKLGPAFEVLTGYAIKAIDGISSWIGKLDAQAIADKVSSGLEKAMKYWDAFKSAFSGVGGALLDAFKAVASSISGITGAFGSAESVEGFKGAMESVANVVKGIAGFVTEHSDAIAKVVTMLPKIALGIKAFKVAKSVAPGVLSFAQNVAKIAFNGIGSLASKLFGISKGVKSTGDASAASAKQILAAGAAFLMIGVGVMAAAAGFWMLADAAVALADAGPLAIGVMAGLVLAVIGLGVAFAILLKSVTATPAQMLSLSAAMLSVGLAVLMVGAGFWLMANAAIALTEAGWPAIAVMAGMVIVIAALAVGAALLGPVLTAGAIGFIAFGAAVLMCGLAAVLAAAAIAIIAAVLPTLCEYGLQGAVAIGALGVGLLVFAAGAAVAGVACAALAVGLAAAAIAVAACAVAVGALAVAALGLGAALLVAGAGLALIAGVLPTIATYGLQAAAGLAAIGGALAIIALSAAGSAAAFIAFAAALAAVAVSAPLAGAALLLLAGGLWLVADNCLKAGIGTALMASSLPVIAALCWDAMIALISVSGGIGEFAGAAGPAGTAAQTLGAALALCAVGSSALAKNVVTLAVGVASVKGSLDGMTRIIGVLEKQFSALGRVAESSMARLVKSLADAASKAKSAGVEIGTGFATGVQRGLMVAPTMVSTVMIAITTLMMAAKSPAMSAGRDMGTGFTQQMVAGLTPAVPLAASMVSAAVATLRAGRAGAYSAGAYVAAGFAAGMASQLSYVQSVASQLAAAAEAAIEAKAKIASPSKVTTKLGEFWGVGFVNGIASMASAAWDAAENLVSVPVLDTPSFATSYAGELSEEYEYSRYAEYVIEVPVNIDGRETARVLAPYSEAEQNKLQRRNSRKHGRA